MEEEAALADELVVRQIVTVSYHDAGRWLDAQETVEQVPAPPDVVQWVQDLSTNTMCWRPSAASALRKL